MNEEKNPEELDRLIEAGSNPARSTMQFKALIID
jgi:hypothetical protein